MSFRLRAALRRAHHGRRMPVSRSADLEHWQRAGAAYQAEPVDLHIEPSMGCQPLHICDDLTDRTALSTRLETLGFATPRR